MKNLTRILLVLVLAVFVAACASQKKKDDSMIDDTSDQERVTTQPADDANRFMGRDRIDDPNSMLATRVIYFDFDSSRIRSEFRDVLREHGRYLAEFSDVTVTLQGHADERGTREYNLGLGERRGNSVADVLRAQGASSSQIEVVSYGEERPTCDSNTESCWQQNRRVVIEY